MQPRCRDTTGGCTQESLDPCYLSYFSEFHFCRETIKCTGQRRKLPTKKGMLLDICMDRAATVEYKKVQTASVVDKTINRTGEIPLNSTL